MAMDTNGIANTQPPHRQFKPLPALPARRTYRLGVSSYVYPTDLLTGIRHLAGCVDDVELVLFGTPEASNIPSTADIDQMALIAARSQMTYTVHFPIQFRIGDAERRCRRSFLDQARQLIALTRALPVWCYILHLEGIHRAADASAITRWQADCMAGVEELLSTGVPPQMFTVENLSAPFAWCQPLIDRYDLAICIDIGHLWLGGYDVAAHLGRYLPRTRLIHLHGENRGQDHISLTHVEPERLVPVIDALRHFAGVVTLEVFNYDDTASSIDLLGRT